MAFESRPKEVLRGTSLETTTFRMITHDHGNRARSFKVEIASADQSGPGGYGGWGRGPRGSGLRGTSLVFTEQEHRAVL